ncbi:MAG TPA: metalloregulator ArsR/SmtB family transcription factor [Casimicrobiaceae bacterium]
MPRSDRLDLVFRALGDKTRRALLARLRRGPAMITELAAPFDLSLPAVSRHVKVLERARMIRRTVDGRVHRCEIDGEVLRIVDQWLDPYRRFWDETLESLARYAER